MRQTTQTLRMLGAAALSLAGALCWPTAAQAQTASGNAKVVQATLLGSTTVLSSTGDLAGSSDVREASLLEGTVPSLLAGEVLHAAAIGWTDQAYSEASLGALGMSVAGNGISADFVMSRALAVTGALPVGVSQVDGLAINGLPVAVTGAPNQTIPLLGGRLILNEQQASATGVVVNAVHVIIDGIADVVVASASAGMPTGGSTSPLPPLPLPPVL